MAVQAQPKSTVARKGLVPSRAVDASIDLYWLPLGAGGHVVRFNGHVYEAIHARLERRRPLDLYHSALEVRVPEGRFVIENSWPIPDANGAARGSRSKVQSEVAALPASASSAMRSGAGAKESSWTSAKQSQAPSASATI